VVQLECRDPSLRAPVPEGLARAARETRPELQMNLLHRPQVAGADFVGDRDKA
jgi:hypothetical protein